MVGGEVLCGGGDVECVEVVVVECVCVDLGDGEVDCCD